MEINITKQEYLKLLDVLYIADWVMHSFSVEERTETKEHKHLEQKFLSMAKEFGLEDLVEAEDGEYMPTRKFDETTPASDFIHEYDEESFWTGLIDKLTIRDAVVEFGLEAVDNMYEDEEVMEEVQKIEEFYAKEFNSFGILNLNVSD